MSIQLSESPVSVYNRIMHEPEIPPTIADALREDLFAGHKIVAIKRYRDATRCELKEAKDAVEAYEARLRVSDPGRFSHPPNSGGCGWFLFVALGAVIAAAALAWRLLK